MDLRMLMLAAAAFGAPAKAEVIVACTFPTLPSAVMRFPDGLDAKKTMEVGARPPVELIEGNGAGRLISAAVDGFDFRFAPDNSTMDVEKDGTLILSETGKCVTIGGPTSDAPLAIPAPSAASGEVVAADAPETEAEMVNPGKWVVREDKSAFDDSRTVILSIDSDEPIRGQFGAPGPAVLQLRCMEDTTSVYLWLNDLFLSDIEGYGFVDYRIDELQAASVQMSVSTDNKALGLWSGGKAIPYLEQLIGAKKVVFRATPFNESPVEFSFDLAGLETAISPLREACAW